MQKHLPLSFAAATCTFPRSLPSPTSIHSTSLTSFSLALALSSLAGTYPTSALSSPEKPQRDSIASIDTSCLRSIVALDYTTPLPSLVGSSALTSNLTVFNNDLPKRLLTLERLPPPRDSITALDLREPNKSLILHFVSIDQPIHLTAVADIIGPTTSPHLISMQYCGHHLDSSTLAPTANNNFRSLALVLPRDPKY